MAAAGATGLDSAGLDTQGAAATMGSTIDEEDLDTLDYREENLLDHDEFWIPPPPHVHPDPEVGSPAEALRHRRQLWFLDGLSPEPPYTDMLYHADMVCFNL